MEGSQEKESAESDARSLNGEILLSGSNSHQRRDEGKCMLVRENWKSKALAALGVIGLLVGFWAPRASAQVTGQGPFSNGNYSGRYACLTMSGASTPVTTAPAIGIAIGGEFATAVIKYNPDGKGEFTAGTLVADEAGVVDAGDPSHFCSYTLDTTKSTYTLDSHGIGSETLVWNAAAGNDDVCPCSKDNLCNGNGFFTEETILAIRNQLNSNNFTMRADHSSTNLFNFDEPGHGYCVK
jgi:hypothetical protein